MDLGIKGRKAIVCGASAGLGRATATALAREGVSVVIAARDEGRVRQAATDIAAETGGEVTAVAADVTTEAGRTALLAACQAPDILINNAGGPPPGDFRTWTRDDWLKAIDGNMLSAIFLIQATLDGMIARKFGRVVNITSHMVKAPIAQLGLSNAARTGLTGFVAGTARQVADRGVTINNLLPGIHDTDRAVALDGGVVKARGLTMEEARAERMATIPARRYGTAEEFGATCAFLCGQQAGFIVGQNILLDGGATNLTM